MSDPGGNWYEKTRTCNYGMTALILSHYCSWSTVQTLALLCFDIFPCRGGGVFYFIPAKTTYFFLFLPIKRFLSLNGFFFFCTIPCKKNCVRANPRRLAVYKILKPPCLAARSMPQSLWGHILWCLTWTLTQALDFYLCIVLLPNYIPAQICRWTIIHFSM